MRMAPLLLALVASTFGDPSAAAPSFPDLLRGKGGQAGALLRPIAAQQPAALLQRGAAVEPTGRLGGGPTPTNQPQMTDEAEKFGGTIAKHVLLKGIGALFVAMALAALVGGVCVWYCLRQSGVEAKGRAADLWNLRSGILADLDRLKKDKAALKGGVVENEGGFVRAGPSSVASVAGHTGRYLDRLELTMRQAGPEVYGENGGAPMPHTELGECEYLSTVEQYSKHDTAEGLLGGGVRFTTSLGRTIDYSGEHVDRKHVVRYDAATGFEIVRLTFKGAQLQGIGTQKLPIVVTISVRDGN